MNKTVVTKARFAEMHGRVPSAVSNWIAEGKISKAALIGDGVRARIWVERADADLAMALDPAQQTAQEVPVSGAPVLEPAGDTPSIPPVDDLARRRRADADRAEHEAEKARRQNEVDRGRWVDAESAKRSWAREFANEMAAIETFLGSTLAHAIADEYGLDWKKLAAEIRAAWREHRKGAAAVLVERLAELTSAAA